VFQVRARGGRFASVSARTEQEAIERSQFAPEEVESVVVQALGTNQPNQAPAVPLDEFFATPTGSVGPEGQIFDVFRADGTRVTPEEAQQIGLTPDVIRSLPVRPAPEGFVSEFLPLQDVVAEDGIAEAPQIELPEPTAVDVNAAVLQSFTESVQQKKQSLKQLTEAQVQQLERQKQETERLMKEAIAGREEALDEVKELTEPFRKKIEETERERLKVEQNFFENQQLVEELDSLLSEGNRLIDQLRSRPQRLSQINRNINRAVEAINARVSVINAVINARNGQIGQAFRLIDRSVAAITADRNDRLRYYQAIINAYEKQRDEQGRRLIQLEEREANFLKEQIKVLRRDIDESKLNAENIKQMMMNPRTAKIVADAGITLNDTPEQVSKKIADYQYTLEVNQLHQQMQDNGYEWIPTPEQARGIPESEIVSRTDSRGQEHLYRKPKEQTKYEIRTVGRKVVELQIGEDGRVISQRVIAQADAARQEDRAPTLEEDIASMSLALQSRVGQDGFVSPSDYATAKREWVLAGRKSKDFDEFFATFRNPNDFYILDSDL